MHADTAAKLREYWEERGDPPCNHPIAELESVSDRYLTGRHVCTTCGAVLTFNREIVGRRTDGQPDDMNRPHS